MALAVKRAKLGHSGASDTRVEAAGMPVRRGPIEHMPWDILLEVFSVMHPRDLLPLVRTSKAFRTFLTGQNAERIWKGARMRASKDVPERPAHLSETQYTALLFAESCSRCGESGIKLNVIWVFFGRWCESCEKERLVSGDAIEDLMREVKALTDCGSSGDFLAVITKETCDRFCYVSTKYYHQPEVVWFKEIWISCKDDEEKKKLVSRRVATVNERTKCAKALERWATIERRRQLDEEEAIRVARVHGIIGRLKEEGWGLELDWMGPSRPSTLRYHLDGANVAQVLTDAGWRKIREQAVAYMGTIRTARLAEERREAVIKRLRMLRDTVAAYDASLGPRDATSDLRAEFADLALMPAVRELVGAPTEADIKAEDIIRKKRS